MATPTFHTLRVADIRTETPSCVSVAFEVPAALRPAYAFEAGQYLTLKTTLHGQEVRRSYSICSSPQEGEWRVAIKAVPNGVFSTYANEQLRVGDTLDVMTPMGNFSPDLQPDAANNYVAFAAGSGITPIISIIKTVLQTAPKSNFTLFYGNKGTEHIIFRDELENLKNLHLERLSIHHIFSKEAQSAQLFNGHIDGNKCHTFAKVFFEAAATDAFFICGPESMIHGVKDTLLHIGVPPNRIHTELFTTALMPRTPNASVRNLSAAEQQQLRQVKIILDGNQLSFQMPTQALLLDAALANGADLPFACKGGVCCTCKAKVLQGDVSMDLNYGLEPDEVAAGYVLTCQAHPLSEEVVISFDA